MKTVRVMIADPLVEVADRLEKILGEDKRIEVVARATTAAECLKKAPIANPHVILMDLRFEDMVTTQLIRELSKKELAVAVLIVSPQAIKDSPLVDGCLVVGAFDFIHRPRGLDELEKIGRQILNRIFVASFSKTKQIPTGDKPPAGEPVRVDATADAAAAALGAPRPPDVIVVDFPEEHARELLVILTSIHPGLKPAVVLVIRRPPPFAHLLVQKIHDRVQFPIKDSRAGDYIEAGKVLVLDHIDYDLVVERNVTDEWVQLARTTTPRERDVPTPGIDRLLESLALTYEDRATAILLGGDPQAAADGVRAIKSRGGTAMVCETATALLSELSRLATPPDRTISVAQIASLINGEGADSQA